MNIYEKVFEYLTSLPLIQAWPELLDLLRRAAAKHDQNWQLPLFGCLAVGGTVEQAVAAIAAIACLQISIILVDDLLDEDPRGEYHRIGKAAAANLAIAFQALGIQAITNCQANESIKLRALQCLSQMAYTTALGQHLDVQNPADEDAYWRIVETKSAPFFGAALYLGALMAEAEAQVGQTIEKFGRIYGVMTQIFDDLHDTLAVPANSDWTLGRSPLPILFALEVNHPDQVRFKALRKDISAPGALAEAQHILIRCCAVSYCVDQLLEQQQVAQQLLAILPAPVQKELTALLDEQILPVQELLATLEAPLPEIASSGHEWGNQA